MTNIDSICFLGFGEAGSTLAGSLVSGGFALSAIDNQFDDEDSAVFAHRKTYSSVHCASEPDAKTAAADLVISLVTAEQDIASAQWVARHLKKGAWFLDLNSVSPDTKQQAADVIAAAGGRYVEGAIMSPIQPKGIASPILLGGPDAEAFLPQAKELGFTGARFYDKVLGRAAASKMCRSIMIKGLESLLAESLYTARCHGVEDEVIQSLNNLMPGVNWQEHSAYMISRSIKHGVRRAEEMREAAKTVAETGIQSHMSSASARTQEWVAGLDDELADQPLPDLLGQMIEILSNDL